MLNISIGANVLDKESTKFYILFGIVIVLIAWLTQGCGQPTDIPATPGPMGEQGIPGTNGFSLVYTTTNAPQGSCGLNYDGSYINGTIILMAQDSNENEVYDTTDSNQSSILICDGKKGEDGKTGATGPQGPQGNNATNVSIVQFCTGYKTTYPTMFPEFGICINNNIYAVYLDSKNAWLSLIVPGYYKSTSTTAPCNFAVSYNCSITN